MKREALNEEYAGEPVMVEEFHALDKAQEEAEVSSLADESKPFYSLKSTRVRRGLKPRHVQLIGIGGTIGTASFVQIAGVFNKGGPASSFIGFSAWCIPIVCLTFTTAEMVTQFPVPSPFTRLAGRFFDEAVEVASGWNFFISQATLVPFEITSVTYIIYYWSTDFSPWMVILPQVISYILINSICPVKWYGEVEFWMSISKVSLIFGLSFFTFITMVGGNPQHDAYGFRYWKNPGAFAEWFKTGDLGRFLGFASCFTQASYTIAGPDYVSMAAGETMNPRKVSPRAYKGVLYRLSMFFMLGTSAMGIVCAYNDPELVTASTGGDKTASGSPYVIAMERMNIPVLPHIVNVGLIISAFSAGNSYYFCATRTSYSMAMRGHAPPFFRFCLPNGVPIVASTLVVAFAMSSFLQMGNTANQVSSWIVSLGTPAELANYALMSATYLRFYYGMKAQDYDRNTSAFRSWGQPYLAYISSFATFCMTFLGGWAVFLKGNWNTTTFVSSYVIIPFDIAVYVFWKIWKRPKVPALKELDLVSGLEEVEAHEREYHYEPPKNLPEKLWRIFIGDI